jgi:hypothetical protein
MPLKALLSIENSLKIRTEQWKSKLTLSKVMELIFSSPNGEMLPQKSMVNSIKRLNTKKEPLLSNGLFLLKTLKQLKMLLSK